MEYYDFQEVLDWAKCFECKQTSKDKRVLNNLSMQHFLKNIVLRDNESAFEQLVIFEDAEDNYWTCRVCGDLVYNKDEFGSHFSKDDAMGLCCNCYILATRCDGFDEDF